MPVNLAQPLAWQSANGDALTMLENLQPNILKAHTREFLTLLFLHFNTPQDGKDFLKNVAMTAGVMKSAMTHLLEVQAFNASPSQPGTPYVGVGVTAAGYAAMQIAGNKVPSDPSFAASMQGANLNDPAVNTWDMQFRTKNDLHACLLIGDTTMEGRSAAHDMVATLLSAAAGVHIIGTQDGLGLHNANGDGIEHFGYVDGRSQPIFLVEDIADENDTTDGAKTWDPAFPLSRVLVADPGMPDGAHFGSYFVFRKLEQNVKKFKTMESEFADALQLDPDDRERAGSMLIGRFEDGTPATMQKAAGTNHPVPNNFNYDSDGTGSKCPFAGHIRKVNPRGSTAATSERDHIMARRGQTYGVRTDNPNDGQLANKPEKNVGLLFMAFNSNIAEQFEFTQESWANNPDFPHLGSGIDPVIGQMPRGGHANGLPRPQMFASQEWGHPGSVRATASPEEAVTMKGGEYFFMPSLATLRAGFA